MQPSSRGCGLWRLPSVYTRTEGFLNPLSRFVSKKVFEIFCMQIEGQDSPDEASTVIAVTFSKYWRLSCVIC